jgi:hypothetical protein
MPFRIRAVPISTNLATRPHRAPGLPAPSALGIREVPLRPGEVMAALDTPEVKHPERAEYRLPREAVGAVRGHLVTPNQEVADPVVDVVVDR